MRRPLTLIISMLMACLLFGAAVSNAKSVKNASVVSSPTVTLEHWKNTPKEERYSFLLGVISMLEIERAWQGSDTMPVSQTLVPTWTKGLMNVTIQQMDDSLMLYAKNNPSMGDRSVFEALGRIYVMPKMSKAERTQSLRRYQTLSSHYWSQQR